MNWPMVKLKDCCSVVGGATPKRDVPEYWSSKDIPWVTPKDISTLDDKILQDAPEYISQKGYEKSATYLLPEGSVLLTSRAPIGNVAIAGKAMCTNQGFKSLVPSKETDSTYLYYCISAYSNRLEALGNGATFKEVSKKTVEEFEIPLPPLDEQKRIAAILDKADSIRRKRQHAIQLADDFLRSVFLDMFGDPVTNPKGWRTERFGNLAEFINGDRSSNYPSGSDIVEDGILFLSTKNIVNDQLSLVNKAFITPQKFESLSRGKLARNDLVITLRGTLGSCAIFDTEFETGFINAQIMIIRCGVSVLPEYLHSLISCAPFKSMLQKIGQGAAVKQLTASQLSSIEVPVPEIEQQKKFVETLGALKNTKSKQSSAVNVVLFESLSQKAFAGEL